MEVCSGCWELTNTNLRIAPELAGTVDTRTLGTSVCGSLSWIESGVPSASCLSQDVRSSGNDAWQQTSAVTAEGELVNAAASVRSTGKVT